MKRKLIVLFLMLSVLITFPSCITAYVVGTVTDSLELLFHTVAGKKITNARGVVPHVYKAALSNDGSMMMTGHDEKSVINLSVNFNVVSGVNFGAMYGFPTSSTNEKLFNNYYDVYLVFDAELQPDWIYGLFADGSLEHAVTAAPSDVFSYEEYNGIKYTVVDEKFKILRDEDYRYYFHLEHPVAIEIPTGFHFEIFIMDAGKEVISHYEYGKSN
ncbi:MAG: hypothetical protein MJ052_05285 [Sphaerochaetaceae bacterium]|nr:hypothetical protein [Sphaerochaetaceae bacterium]